MTQGPTKIDIAQVIRTRLPKHSKYIPRFVVRWLERTICQERLNDILTKMSGKDGVSAAQAALDDMGIKTQAEGMENLPNDDRLLLFVSNHPLGGLDGLCLISLLGEHYHHHIRFLVNDLLMNVKPLRDIFLPVNKFGRQSRQAAADIEQQYHSHNQMITFPAGLCSRMQDDGTITDLEWKKSVITHATTYQRDVVPIYFDAHNSAFFYRLARLRKRLGIKFNVEMMFLPKEMLKQSNTTLSLKVGKPINWQTFDKTHPQQEAQRLKHIVYSMANHPHSSRL